MEGEKYKMNGDLKMEKPINWPCNNHEYQVEIVNKYLDIYIKDPSLENKEILVSLVNQDELNEKDTTGEFRICQYEYYLLSKIYSKASLLMFNGIKVFVYRHIIDIIILRHIIEMFPNDVTTNVKLEEPEFLLPSLHIFYSIYYNFRYYYKTSFSESFLKSSNDIDFENKKQVYLYVHAILPMLNDLSYNTNANVFMCINFSRDEIYKMFEIVFKCINVLYPLETINKSPLHGILCTAISNWILKSRYNYNKDHIFKSLPDEAAYNYEEVWMKTIETLNDDREGMVINEVLADNSWKKYKWMNITSISSIRKTYVTCFSKAKPTDKMRKEYGRNYYAYKSDRIADLISAQFLYKKNYANNQVFFFDVIYDKDLLKEELNFLAKIIDLSIETDDEKKKFFDDILQYWIYSIKDADKWQDERERRYVCYFYDSYNYLNAREENGFMKIKSSLFMFPDYINHNNCMFDQLYANVHLKLTKLHHKKYMFCNSCLYADFDITAHNDVDVCPQCGSKNISFYGEKYKG